MRRVAYCSAAAAAAAGGWFTWPEYEEGLEKRRRVVMQIQNQFMRDRNTLLQEQKPELNKQDYVERRRHFREQPFDGSGHLFNLRQGREKYLEEFGCVRINSTAIEAIKRLNMPVVEMGAGLGQWAKALKNEGVTVTAIDSKKDLPLVYAPEVFPVEEGTERALLGERFKNHALLLVCPTGTLALQSVENHQSQIVVYVGEGRRGHHGTRQFFDLMERDFELLQCIDDLPVFDEYSFERMWVLRRKKK